MKLKLATYAVIAALAVWVAWKAGSLVQQPDNPPRAVQREVDSSVESTQPEIEARPLEREPALPNWVATVNNREEVSVRSEDAPDVEVAVVSVPDALGKLPDPVLSEVLDRLDASHKRVEKERSRFVADNDRDARNYHLTLSRLDHMVQRSNSKIQALLEQSYVVLPTGGQLPKSMSQNPDLTFSVITAPLGSDVVGIHIVMDLRADGALRESLDIYLTEKQAAAHRAAQEVNALADTEKRRFIEAFEQRSGSGRWGELIEDLRLAQVSYDSSGHFVVR